MKTPVIPDPLEPFSITEELQNKLNQWIDYFRNLSPRIRLIFPIDKDFDLEEWEQKAKIFTEVTDELNDIVLFDWPRKTQVAFLLGYNSALPGHEDQYLVENGHVFCFGNVAFSLSHFGRDEEDFGKRYHYSLSQYSKDCLEWKFIAKLIKDRLIEIETSVPPLS